MRQLCIDQLEDFLKDRQLPLMIGLIFKDRGVTDYLSTDTATFVDDVFRVVRTKAYLPGGPPVGSAPLPDPHLDPTTSYDPKAPGFPANGAVSMAGQRRKRSFNEQEANMPGMERNSFHARHLSGERTYKQPRRGGPRGGRFDGPGVRGGRIGPIGRGQDGGAPNMSGQPQPGGPGFPGMVPPVPPFPFDPNDPMAAMMAMQMVGFPGMPVLPPGLPPLPSPFSPTNFGQDPMAQTMPATDGRSTKKINERCKDYDEKGFCARGNTCPYDHGVDHMVVPGQSEGVIFAY